MQRAEKPASVGSAVVWGVDAVPVTIEATVRGTTGSPRILGRVDPGIREAYHRITSAFRAAGLESPRGCPTINFVPASIRKSGSGFDLPMAMALAGAAGLFPPQRLRNVAALGEISLEGAVLSARGAVAVAVAARERGWDQLLASPADAALATLVPGVEVLPVHSLREALLWLRGDLELAPATRRPQGPQEALLDLADVRGHRTPKTALLVAAAGRHNLLLVGPPGSGKTALLRRLTGIMPATTAQETLEILKIHSCHSDGGGVPLGRRPFRAPHHTSSHVSLLGGGSDPRPGEVTLAHRGVLFLDELAEFRREALEGLRQPLEEGSITIGRALRTATMPADFVLVAAMNPCPCGYLGHPLRPCVCTASQRQRYRTRLSGPLLDRFDLLVEVPALPAEELSLPPDPAHGTERMRGLVANAIARQMDRSGSAESWIANGRLADQSLERAVRPGPQLIATLEQVMRSHRLSGRARVRLLRTARTLADLDDRAEVRATDILSAARLRGLERMWAS